MGRVSDTAHDGPHLTPHPLPLQANLKKIEKANPSVSRAVQTRYMAALLLRKQDHVVEEMQVTGRHSHHHHRLHHRTATSTSPPPSLPC